MSLEFLPGNANTSAESFDPRPSTPQSVTRLPDYPITRFILSPRCRRRCRPAWLSSRAARGGAAGFRAAALRTPRGAGGAATADVARARGLLGFARPSSSAVVSIGIGSGSACSASAVSTGSTIVGCCSCSDSDGSGAASGVRRLRSLERLTGEHAQPAAPIALDAHEPFPLARAQQVHQPAEAVSALVESARPGGPSLHRRSLPRFRRRDTRAAAASRCGRTSAIGRSSRS